MSSKKILNEYKSKNIIRLIFFSKFFEAFLEFSIGIIQFILVVRFDIYVRSLIDEIFPHTFELDVLPKLFKDERIIFLFFLIYTLFSLYFMYNASLFVFERFRFCKMKIDFRSFKNICLLFLFLPCLVPYFIYKITVIIKNSFSFGELCWNRSYFITKTSRFILHLCWKLFGFSLNCVCLDFLLRNSPPSADVSTQMPLFNWKTTFPSNESNNFSMPEFTLPLEVVKSSVNSNEISKEFIYMRDHLIANIVLHFFRILIMVLYFKYCTLYNPIPAEKLDKRNGGFMRLEELESSSCFADSQCGSTDLEHILKSHTYVHKPWRKCNPCYLVTCRKNYFVGFHQTSTKAALGIAKNGFRLGSGGMFGAGIYFARTIDHTDQKALNNGAVICALVDLGNKKVPTKWTKQSYDINLEWLQSLDGGPFDSIYAKKGVTEKGSGQMISNDEFVVYEPERVKKWIVCYPSNSKDELVEA